MKRAWRLNHIGIRVPVGGTRIVLDPSWLMVLPLSLWAIITLYMPVMGSFLPLASAWVVAIVILLLGAASLAGHVWAHGFAAQRLGSTLPPEYSLLIFGDTAQTWPAAGSAWREVWPALAGPVFNLLVAGLAYLLWNVQINTLWNLSLLFIVGYNIWLFLINLIPAFPFDGGRLVRAILWGVMDRPEMSARLSLGLSYLIPAVLFGWGIFLIAQRSRFSWQTGGVTIAFALLILYAARIQPAWIWDRSLSDKPPISHPLIRYLLSGVLILGLLAIASSLLLTNDGLDAPGPALSVEPMVDVPAARRFPQDGTFILTSVITQAPITAAEWLLGQITPAVKIVPPEVVVPRNTTPQEVTRQAVHMLNESETTAIVVGLQRAGLDATLVGKGAQVAFIEPDSLANGILRPGDIVTAVNGNPVTTAQEMIGAIQAQESGATVNLQVDRNGVVLEVAVPLMPPAQSGGAPRIGISIGTAGFDAQLPFPVQIIPQKIVGGPSAGLMFALTVYNSVTPEDLTGGRRIAGTGTINPDGTVGPIGGVEQKVVAAELAGAAYFLSPSENYAAAQSAARRIQVIEVSTIDEAISFLKGLPPE
jgi:PDZ domain-containing protein